MIKTIVECSKIIQAPESFSFNHLYCKDGRYLQDYVRHSGIRMEFDPQAKTIKLCGKFENVMEVTDFLRRYMNVCTNNHQSTTGSDGRDQKMSYFIVDSKEDYFNWIVYSAFIPAGLQYAPFILHRIKDESQSGHLQSEKMGIKIDSGVRMEAAVKTFGMMLFSEGFESRMPSLRFQLGKQLFFRTSQSSILDIYDGAKVSINALRKADEGIKRDFRSLFVPAITMEIAEILMERLVQYSFKHVKDQEYLRVRLYDRIDDAFVMVKYTLGLDQNGVLKITGIHSMTPAFTKHDTLTVISPVSELQPDIRLMIKQVEYYGPNHPASIYMWPFAETLEWNEESQKITVNSKLPWSRFDINIWERVTKSTFVNNEERFKVGVKAVIEDDGQRRCEISGSPKQLNNKLKKGEKVEYERVLQVIENLRSLILP